MTRIAGDVPQLRSLAAMQRDAALEIVSFRAFLNGPLPSMPESFYAVVAEGLRAAAQKITLTADGLMEQGSNLETAAHYFEMADIPGLGPTFSDSALRVLMQAVTPDGSLAEWSVADWVGFAEGAAVEEIAAGFAGLSAAQRDFLTTTYPGQIGSLDGAPLEMRFAANRLLVTAALEELRAERDRLTQMVAEMQEGWRGAVTGFFPWNPVERELQFVSEKLATVEYLADGLDERQILLFDASGDGRVAEVFGDIENADHIAFVLPGITNDLGDYTSGLRSMASELHRLASRRADDVAVIAWLGYDTPDSPIDGGFPVAAYDGAEDLRRSVDGIRVYSTPVNVTAVGHSYGSVVTGRAIRDEGLHLTDAVLVGSPGIALDVDNRSDLGTGVGDVWVAEAPGDAIPDIPIVHGPNPADEEWGGRLFAANAPGRPEVSGHSDYVQRDSESARNIARIIVGDDHLVSKGKEEPVCVDIFGAPVCSDDLVRATSASQRFWSW